MATISGPLERWLSEALGAADSEAGVPVTESTVRGLPAAWYSINKIAGHVGSLPINLYNREEDEDARIAREHPAYWLVKHKPNDLMTAGVWRETMQHHVLLHGNGRSAILRNGRGEPHELVLLQPREWSIVVQLPQVIEGVRVPQRKWHVRVNDPQSKIDDRDCLHIMGLSDDGMSGLSVIDAAKQSLGLAIAQQWRAVKSEKNGAKIKFLLKAPPGAFRKEGEAQEFIDKFNAYHAGADNVDKVGLLREGIEAQTIAQTNQESQAIEGRTFSRQDIGLLFMVEQMLGDDSSVSYNSLEMKNQAYLTNCLMRWLVRWQEECAAKLLTTAEWNSEQWYFRFVTQALLRGTTKERFDVYNIGRQIGVFSANEVRELEDMNEREDADGDKYDNPAITPGKPKNAKPTPAQPMQPDDEDDDDEKDNAPAVAARLAKVVRAHVGGLVNVECRKVEQAAASEKDFCGWLNAFYAGWNDKLTTTISECGGEATLSDGWTRDSEERLLTVAGRVSADGLPGAVRAEVATWGGRIDLLVASIITQGTTA